MARGRAQEKTLPSVGQRAAPTDHPVGTDGYRVVVFTEITGELVDRSEVAESYPNAEEEHVRAMWRSSFVG